MTDRTPSLDTDHLADDIIEVARRVHQLVSLVAARHELTAQRLGLSRMLEEPVSMRAFAHDLSCDPSNVTGLVDRVERLGLVERVLDPCDRRVRMLSLTAKGRRIRDQANHDLAGALSGALALTPSIGGEIERLLGAVNRGASPCRPQR